MSVRPRVVVTNRSDGGLIYWLFKFYTFTLLGLLLAMAATGIGVYVYFSHQVPPLPDLDSYSDTVPQVTQMVAQDGSLIGEFSNERREIVPLAEIPRPLIDAFVATEDRRFFSHQGLDLRGMLRALWTNLRAHEVVQGGSTITQQVAKSYLSPERTFSRKIKEAIFARRLEARYSKREILALYLNHIFLGNGAYGVGAAARRYFDRDLSELNVSEWALIAGLARGSTRYSPVNDEEAALARRNTVLDNMVEVGKLTAQEGEKWKNTPLQISPRRDYFHEVAPYFAEELRRQLVKKLGQKQFYQGGYRVETTVLPFVDVAAEENVDAATRKLDKRQGWRGPETRLDAARAKIFAERSAELYGAGLLDENRLYLGLVESVTPSAALIRVGSKLYLLPVANMQWAARYTARDASNDAQLGSATEALHKFDVIWVRSSFHSRTRRFSEFSYDEKGEVVWQPAMTHPRPAAIELTLEQRPRVQGAIYAFDHQNGYVLAMAGGNDFDQSQFNRVTQACRQPGSSYKPIYYSLALDRGYAYDTLWTDKPKAEIDPVTGELWVPQNVDGSYGQKVTLERALVWSKNPPSVEIFRLLGSDEVERWAYRLGLTTPLITSPKCKKQFCSSLALGASCTHMDDMTRAFAVFARMGRSIEPTMIRRLIDRKGEIIEDNTSYDDPFLPAADKFNRIAAKAGIYSVPVIEPRTAYLTTKLLREIVTTGHSAPIRATKIIAAGKTGTSSRTSDVWFIGFTSRWMVSAWIGDDTYERQLGYKDASFSLSVPMWARFVAEVASSQPLDEIPWELPPGVRSSDSGGPLKPGMPPPPPIIETDVTPTARPIPKR